MWWFIGITAVIVVVWLVARWGGRDVRYIGLTVGTALKIKPHIIEQMAMAMGEERSAMLAKQLRSWPETMQTAITTVYVYQVEKNPHPENVKWWRIRLVEQGFSADLSLDNVETAFMFLRNAGPQFDASQSHKFLAAYQQQLA